MKYFFIDTENVQQYNFLENADLNEDDKIIMLMSQRSNPIRAVDLRKFTECKASIEYEDVVVGEKNALDFQLIAHLAITAASNI